MAEGERPSGEGKVRRTGWEAPLIFLYRNLPSSEGRRTAPAVEGCLIVWMGLKVAGRAPLRWPDRVVGAPHRGREVDQRLCRRINRHEGNLPGVKYSVTMQPLREAMLLS